MKSKGLVSARQMMEEFERRKRGLEKSTLVLPGLNLPAISRQKIPAKIGLTQTKLSFIKEQLRIEKGTPKRAGQVKGEWGSRVKVNKVINSGENSTSSAVHASKLISRKHTEAKECN